MEQNFKLLYYVDHRGLSEFKQFIEKQTLKTQYKMIVSLSLLEHFGPNLKEPHSKHILNGLFELRNQSQNGHIRIFYFRVSKDKFLITHGFIKKTNKTAIKEIEKAFRLKEQYEKRIYIS